jgi:hypothetical protein
MGKIKKEVLPQGFEVRDLVGISWQSLNKVFKSLEGKDITPADLPHWKLALGFVNATNNTVKTSMQCFKLSSLPQAVKMVKEITRKRKEPYGRI